MQNNTAYFVNYTGIKNWGKNKESQYFANIHQTRLRINYTYYNSPELTRRIFDWYSFIDPVGDHFDCTIIDDGSQKYPITDLECPKHWTVLRIDKDHGWNNEGARNCLMAHTTNRWNLLLDSDWLITKKNLTRIKRAISSRWLDKSIVYMPGNFGPACMRNSFLVSKSEFWRRGGYDQAFIGLHGNDYSFLKMEYEYDFSDFFRLARLTFDVVDPKDKNRIEEVKKYHQLLIELEEQGYGYRDKSDKQDFTWTDEAKHQSMWKDLEYKVIQ